MNDDISDHGDCFAIPDLWAPSRFLTDGPESLLRALGEFAGAFCHPRGEGEEDGEVMQFAFPFMTGGGGCGDPSCNECGGKLFIPQIPEGTTEAESRHNSIESPET